MKRSILAVVSNLIANAIKFTPKGGNIYISTGTKEDRIILKIKVTGIGIDEADLPHVFDRFYQADDSHTRHGEGTGIALALSRELVKLMEGTIAVKSYKDQGSEFEVALPISQIMDFKEQIREVPFLESDIGIEDLIPDGDGSLSFSVTEEDMDVNSVRKNPLILIADDNEAVCTDIASCLKEDYAIEIAKNGQECEDMVFTLTPDLIVLNVMMPFKDGFEVCNTLKTEKRTSNIPIIMLTVKADLDRSNTTSGVAFPKEAQVGSQNQSIPLANSLDHAFVIKVRKEIEAHLDDANFDVEKLCRSVALSHSQVHRKLSALTGLSATHFIRYVRLVKAKELILHSDFKLAAIANDCGFNDPAYFSRVFKKEFGVTPQAWREKNSI